MPKQLPARLSTVQQACPSATFEANPASCDAGSVVGTGTASTPVLSTPLTGTAYLVSHGGEAFPDLVVVLQAQGITIDLVGNVFISKSGVTSVTFAHVPGRADQPVRSEPPQGPHSALSARGELVHGAGGADDDRRAERRADQAEHEDRGHRLHRRQEDKDEDRRSTQRKSTRRSARRAASEPRGASGHARQRRGAGRRDEATR